MVLIQPFSATLPESKNIDPSRFVSLPYDLITPNQYKDILNQAEPHIMKVDLPSYLTDSEKERAMEKAVATLKNWLHQGILKTRAESGLFRFVREYHDTHGHLHQMQGLVALLHIKEFSQHEVFAHENTHAAQVEQRIEYFLRVGLQSSPVFMIYRANDPIIPKTLEDITQGRASLLDVITPDGFHDQVWLISEPEEINTLQNLFLEVQNLLIADGHHRFEALRQIRQLYPDRPLFHSVLVFLADPWHTDIELRGYHRTVKLKQPMKIADILHRAERFFTVEATGPLTDFDTIYEEHQKRFPVGSFMVLDAENQSCHLLHIRPETHQHLTDPYDNLDINIINRFFLKECMDINPYEPDAFGISYEADRYEILHSIAQHAIDYAVIVNAIPLETLFQLARMGRTTPPKSTFFFPKVPAGLVTYVNPEIHKIIL